MLITGAAGGLGSTLASAFAERGCNLILIDINRVALEKLDASLTDQKIKRRIFCIDLCNKDEIKSLSQKLSHSGETPDIIINNAGMTLQKSVESHSDADWQKVFDLNFWSTVHISRECLPALKEKNGGHIVNLSSMAACYGIPSQSSYSSSKAAVRAFSESLRAELAGYNIGVSSIHPGAIKTDMMMATLKESDDLEIAKKNLALAQRFGVSPEKAAQKIITAIMRNRAHCYIGLDAHLFRLFSKLAPNVLSRVFSRAYSKVSNVKPAGPA
ncbi:SDR family oxidoreductase [Spongiibacter sp. KMU-158]|uniref:SDR family oxidoreductase n=1 Tax=Spongiibacter pelagi TaxID=2760804 RepID=A0A927C5N4_9GAMM|nr:SDR family oxidoreductase [Spongiibacter pelagi]MBD2859855.1 SDR family oxidoreductase [Spongiibacter pelagi]